MAALSLPFTLAFAGLLLALVAEARTLPDSYGLEVEIITRYGRNLRPPPPSPVKETSLESNHDEFITPKVVMKSPPPPPKVSPPTGQLETGYISMITNYGRPSPKISPPSPRAAPTSHQVTFPCPEWGACTGFMSVISGYGRSSRSSPSQKLGLPRSSA